MPSRGAAVGSGSEISERPRRGHLARTVEGFVAAGRDLQAARDELPHGEWERLLERVGINRDVAYRLREVASHAVTGDVGNANVLPAGDVTTLYQLSRLPEPELRAAIDAGDVRPDMRRAEKAEQQARAWDLWLDCRPGRSNVVDRCGP